ncbi:GNA1162 family protein [Catenovulum sediminis]|uniref:GNA1162 family protein n=1 Tax=Catenovulum sediminis TaxID=1740262 RepID=A0ABV1RK66_9ALTE
MIFKRIVTFLSLSLVMLMAGCAVSNEDAVLVNAPLNQIENIIEGDKELVELSDDKLPKTLAVLPFENQTESDGAFEIVRRVIYNHISSKNYHMLHWQAVDDKLRLANIDLKTAYQTDAAYLADILEVDAVVFGTITDFDRIFAGIITQIKVGVELKLVNRNGELLWQEEDSATSRAGGASVTPIGLLLNAALATMHLQEENLLRAADDVGRELARVMPAPKRLTTSAGPEIKAVVHNGMERVLKYGDILEVGIQGQPGQRAQAFIEGVGSFDLQEVVAGEYIGKIPVSKKANADSVVVEGVLMDQNGNISRWISPFGLLTIDNIAPEKVGNISFNANNREVFLQWPLHPSADVVAYNVYLFDPTNGEKSLANVTQQNNVALSGLQNFVDYTIAISALDHAGNEGEIVKKVVKALPDSRFLEFPSLSSNIPAPIKSGAVLTQKNSPYYIRQPIQIMDSGVLLVEPGVEIIVSRSGVLNVKGQLWIYGEQHNPVKIKGSDANGFAQFAALNSEQSVELNYLEVDGADVAITIQSGQPIIRNSQFTNNQFSALDISGTAKPKVSNSLIKGSNTAGVIVSGHAQVEFEKCKFENNQPFHIQSSSIYTVQAQNNTWSPAANEMSVLGDVKY